MAIGSQQAFEELAQNPEWSHVEVMEYDCLGNCEQCRVQPFVMVEGQIVAAERPEFLVEAIREYLKEKEELDRQWRELGF